MARTEDGFSLVELMIVVAIIGILAAIAIPNMIAMQDKAKRAELPGNVDGIKTAQLAYETAFDTYLDLTASPAGNPVRIPAVWTASDGNWDTVGWRPDGKVRGLYSADTSTKCTQDPTSYTGATFCVTGQCDVDGDGATVDYYAGPAYNPTIQDDHQNIY